MNRGAEARRERPRGAMQQFADHERPVVHHPVDMLPAV